MEHRCLGSGHWETFLFHFQHWLHSEAGFMSCRNIEREKKLYVLQGTNRSPSEEEQKVAERALSMSWKCWIAGLHKVQRPRMPEEAWGDDE